MSFRQLTKLSSHFLVRYHEDGNLQVRSRGFFHGSDEIDVGKEYEVQWGLGKDDAATADVLASGTEVEMKKKKTEQERQASAAETVSRKPTATAKRKTQAPAPAATSAEQERQTSAADTVPRKPTATAKRKTQASAPAATSPAKKARKTTVTTSKTKASKKTTIATVEKEPVPVSVNNARLDIVPTPISLPVPPNAGQASSPRVPMTHVTNGLRQVSTPVSTTSIQQNASPAPTNAPPEPQRGLTRVVPPPLNLTETIQTPTTAASLSPLCRPAVTFDTPPRRGSPATSDPIVKLLNSINLNLEKVTRRQIDFEQSVHRKLDTTNKRVSNIESTLNTVLGRLDEIRATREGPTATETETAMTDEMFSDVPSHYRLAIEELEDIRNQSSGIGNFALLLTRKLFPELWGPGNLRWNYSYYGGGVLGKQELDPERKSAIVRYVNAYYPATKKSSVWKDSVVPRVNEGLRRKDNPSQQAEETRRRKKKTTENSTLACSQPTVEHSAVPYRYGHDERQVLAENVSYNYTADNLNSGDRLSASLLDISQPFPDRVCVSDVLNEISYDMTADFSDFNQE